MIPSPGLREGGEVTAFSKLGVLSPTVPAWVTWHRPMISSPARSLKYLVEESRRKPRAVGLLHLPAGPGETIAHGGIAGQPVDGAQKVLIGQVVAMQCEAIPGLRDTGGVVVAIPDYEWSQVSGFVVTPSAMDAVRPTFTAPFLGEASEQVFESV